MYAFFKRLLDIVAVVPVVTLMLPVYLLISILIRISSPGRAIFKQVRAGKTALPFVMYKFRTMRPDVDPFGASPNAGDDPRLTKIGKFLIFRMES